VTQESKLKLTHCGTSGIRIPLMPRLSDRWRPAGTKPRAGPSRQVPLPLAVSGATLACAVSGLCFTFRGCNMEERRRCQRLPLAIPVKVYGRTPRNHPFRDVTATMAVSLHGALLKMKPGVKVGQNVLIVNGITEEGRLCRVVSVDAKQRGLKNVAVEFAHAEADFWHVYGPSTPLKPAPVRAPVAQKDVSKASVPESAAG
jgi:hypothetical protein